MIFVHLGNQFAINLQYVKLIEKMDTFTDEFARGISFLVDGEKKPIIWIFDGCHSSSERDELYEKILANLKNINSLI